MHLERPHDADAVVGVEPARDLGRHRLEPRVERGRPRRRRHRLQLAPELGVPRRRRVEPPHERADVEARAAHDDGQPAVPADPLDGRERVGAEARRLVAFVGVHDVDQVMGDGGALGRGRLARGGVEPPVDLA